MTKVKNLQDKIDKAKMNHTYDLEDDVVESFEFTVMGHTYSFRHPNTEEFNEIEKISKGDADKSNEYMYQFITPVGEEVPPFSEVAEKLTIPRWRNFWAMIHKEMGMDTK